MPVRCVVGLGWGDEGKGKVVDFFTDQVDVVVRGQGGANAGHTVVIKDKKYILHLIPSGIFHDSKTCVIGPGVVFDPAGFIEELDMLKKQGIPVTPEKLAVSDRAHLVMPYHKLIDRLEEEAKKGAKIGTTGRGIGPCYADKFSRSGIRIGELLNPEAFKKHLEQVVEIKNRIITGAYSGEAVSADEIEKQYLEYAERIKPFVTDTVPLLHEKLDQGKKILFEGAQGTLLDIDYGTYPYVTSSSPTAGGIAVGTGLPPASVKRVSGIVKAYTTRVGAGPFPTELDNELGEKIRQNGGEFGATTGRPRRCGWLDAVAMRYAAKINGATDMVITKLDVLSGLDALKIATAYTLDGKQISTFPAGVAELEKLEPVYEEMPGWQEDITGCKSFAELPENARKYVERMEQLIETPASIVSVGQKRSESIIRDA